MVLLLTNPVGFDRPALQRVSGEVRRFELSQCGHYVSATAHLVFRAGWRTSTTSQMFVDVSRPFEEQQPFAAIRQDLLDTAWSKLTLLHNRRNSAQTRRDPLPHDEAPSEPEALLRKDEPWMAISSLPPEQEADLRRQLERIMSMPG